MKDIQLLKPDVDRDAPFALGWFNGPEGRQTLLSMGNAENEIKEPTLEGEKDTIREFIDLEANNRQITRMISVGNKTIGAVWVELFENHSVKFPSIHIIIGNPEYRGKGIGSFVMKEAINYVVRELHFKTIYSRHLVNNQVIMAITESLGFKPDGKPYSDDNGLVWQNIKLVIY